MRAEIIAIGTELLLGEIVDTNSAYIASRLPGLGIDVYYKHTVGDNLTRLVEVLRRARNDNDLVITSGGLGPTEDDLTREAISEVMGERPAVDPELEKWLRESFQRRGVTYMPERNLKQAWLIPSAQPLMNGRGTAPGWWAERDGKVIIAMPGPPAEMTPMFEDVIVPRLKLLNPGAILVKRTLKTSGLGEALLDEMISPLLKSENPSIGVYARADGVHVRLAAKAPTEAAALALIGPVEHEVRAVLADYIWGTDDDTIEGNLGLVLKQRGLTVAVMESCTGGLLSDSFTNIPGSSAYFRGGIVSYATEVKELMGVDPAIIQQHGVISAETAAAMAETARTRLQADIGIGLTGVAGPESQEGQPVGKVHVALDGGDLFLPQALELRLGNGRELIKRRAAQQAMQFLRRVLV